MSPTATSAHAPAVDAREPQFLVRVDRGGILIGERELRYPLERKDNHLLARLGEARGLLEAELCFRLTADGRGLPWPGSTWTGGLSGEG